MEEIIVSASITYKVLIERGLLARVGELSAPLIRGRHAAIISDSNVWPLYGPAVEESLRGAGFTVDSFVFPAGETSKNLGILGEILTFLARKEFTRQDAVFALGGGVTGDMGGLASSLFLRGIPYVQIPTSLLAMVDSSVGGKTAVDLPEGKNLVGTFTQPVLVVCDPDALKTLEPAVYAEGWAEIIKYGMILSRGLLEFLLDNPVGTDIEKVIADCVTMKRDVVASDERDTGGRQILNFGHTIGHAIERCAGYRYYHGEGVAMGMAVMTRGCIAKGCCPKACGRILEKLLEKYHLPKTCDIPREDLLKAARADKKRRGDQITLIEPRDVGRCVLVKTGFGELDEILRLGL